MEGCIEGGWVYRAWNEADGHGVADSAAGPQLRTFNEEGGTTEDRGGRHVGKDRRQRRRVLERQGQGVFVHDVAEHRVEHAHTHVHGEGGAHGSGGRGRLQANRTEQGIGKRGIGRVC